MASRPRTIGELRASGWKRESVKDELRRNLIGRLRSGAPLFRGIVGYEDTVVPAITNAVLARHNFILLGLRGQAKTRILRQLVELLDPEIPVLAGSEVNDDPFAPISRFGRQLLEEHGDEAPIEWRDRDARYVEKLATPDVTVSDLVGDMDPIRAARGGHLLSDELTIHFGLVPRANRGIFAINELPDLSAKVQVALFNVMQEGDIQIKGYPVRLPLDILLVFSANPEDYTARGKIITPLKDRIGSEILTHYPRNTEEGMEITRQEAWTERDGSPVRVPEFVAEVIERIAFLARADRRVDRRSGVSQRMPISVLETSISNAERRALITGEDAVVRIADVYAALPSLTGKLELEYEGELQGPGAIGRDLVAAAAHEVFERFWDDDELVSVIEYFAEGGVLQISDTAAEDLCWRGLSQVPGLEAAIRGSRIGAENGGELVAAAELVLEGLAAKRRISRSEGGNYGRAKPERRKGPGGTLDQDLFG